MEKFDKDDSPVLATGPNGEVDAVWYQHLDQILRFPI